jgi:hypothetical protein
MRSWKLFLQISANVYVAGGTSWIKNEFGGGPGRMSLFQLRDALENDCNSASRQRCAMSMAA